MNARGGFRGGRPAWWHRGGVRRGGGVPARFGTQERRVPYPRYDGQSEGMGPVQSDHERRTRFRDPDLTYNSRRLNAVSGGGNGQGAMATGGNGISVRPKGKSVTFWKDTIDNWLERVEQASKSNTIRLSEMVQIDKWPHGEIFFWLVKEVEGQLEAEFFEMVKDHLLEQRKGPASLFDDILQDPGDGNLSEWLARAKARAFNKA